jgi:tetratricopeptide (TPR) repeat protein
MPTGKRKKKNYSGRKTSSRNLALLQMNKAGKKNSRLKQTGLSLIFNKARLLYSQNRFDDVIKLLKSHPRKRIFSQKDEALEFHRLCAFSLTNQGEYNKAFDIAQEALKLDERDRDFYFVKTFISTAFKDFERTIEYGRKFLDLLDGVESEKISYLSNGQLHLLYNYLGIAYKSRNDFEKAVECLKKACDLNPGYEHPYLNLGNLYLQQKDYNNAEEIVEMGLKRCSQVQELMLLKKTLGNRATISACMIVKNEEAMLSGCLESIRSWVDEIIIVDTGSTDRTVEIAKSYGAKLYFQEWTKNFSYHRNFSISKATCDWIFIIDADEEFVLDDLPSLRQAAAQNDLRLVSFNIFNINKETGQTTSFLHSVRLFKREANLRYDGIVHNQLMFDPGEKALRLGISIRHYGYDLSPEKMKQKLDRSRELLEKQLQDDPDNCFVHYNYVQLLRSGGSHPDTETCRLMLKHAAMAIQLSKNDKKYGKAVELMALHQLATTHISLREYAEAKEYCRQALEIKPDFLDAILSMAHACTGLKELNHAEEYYWQYLDKRKLYDETTEEVNLIQIYVGATHLAYYGLGLVSEFKGDFEKAEEYYLEATRHLARFRDIYMRLARIYLDRKDLNKALEFIDKELEWRPESDLAYLYKAEYFAQNNNKAETDYYLEKALELTKENMEVYDRSANFLFNMGEYEKAVPILKKAVELMPDSKRNRKNLAVSYYNIGEFKNAAKAFESYLESHFDDFEAVNDLANCYFKLGEFGNAEKYYTEAMENENRIGLVYRNLGLTKIHLNKPKEALALLEKYSESSPDDLEIELAIGVTCYRIGQYAEAIPHLEKYLFFNPNDVAGLFNISECYLNMGYPDSAAIGYAQILKIMPDYEPALSRLTGIKADKAPA